MKFIVSSSVLLKNLINIGGASANNPIVPILENFLFRIEDGSLQVSINASKPFKPNPLSFSAVLILNIVSDHGKHKNAADEIILEIYKDNKKIHKVHHYDFELVMRRLFEGLGYNVTPTKRTRDGGYDMVAIHDGLIPTSHLIECKSTQKQKKIGIDVVERFLYKISELKASTGIIVTNYKYSLDVLKKYASQAYKHCLKLIDGEEVLDMVKCYVNRFFGLVEII